MSDITEIKFRQEPVKGPYQTQTVEINRLQDQLNSMYARHYDVFAIIDAGEGFMHVVYKKMNRPGASGHIDHVSSSGGSGFTI